MSAVEKNIQWYQTKFQEFEQTLNGEKLLPLHKTRQDAIEQFAAAGFPTTKHEEWRFTNVTALSKIEFQPVLRYDREGITHVYIKDALLPDAVRLVFVNGMFSKELSDLHLLPKNVVVENLATAKKQNPETMAQTVVRNEKANENAFRALNAALWQDGVFISIPKNIKLETPIQILHVASQKTSPFMAMTKNIIQVEEHAQAVVFETYLHRTGNIYCTNAVTDIVLGSDARIDHIKLQAESIHAYHIAHTIVHQEASSVYRSHTIALGSAIARNTITALLDNEHAECTLNGLTLASTNQLIDHHTAIDHLHPHCTSHELYKYVLDEKAHGVFNGKVYVRKDAQKTDAKQTNKTLLLSDEATIDTKPQLEIFADDVKCTHGAAVGQLDAEQIFYLRSRGLGEQEAREVLTYAFAGDVVNRIEHEPIRLLVEAAVTKQLNRKQND
ncbi:MAG TPA: Fe-S cluster assembly protein SufD [Bacteroidota bacterium]|nr:Fe-S cluster assembly protein SufD [Bacteroidota bacterium]